MGQHFHGSGWERTLSELDKRAIREAAPLDPAKQKFLSECYLEFAGKLTVLELAGAWEIFPGVYNAEKRTEHVEKMLAVKEKDRRSREAAKADAQRVLNEFATANNFTLEQRAKCLRDFLERTRG